MARRKSEKGDTNPAKSASRKTGTTMDPRLRYACELGQILVAPPSWYALANKGRTLANLFSMVMVDDSKAGLSSAVGALLLEEASAVASFLPGAMAADEIGSWRNRNKEALMSKTKGGMETGQ